MAAMVLSPDELRKFDELLDYASQRPLEPDEARQFKYLADKNARANPTNSDAWLLATVAGALLMTTLGLFSAASPKTEPKHA